MKITRKVIAQEAGVSETAVSDVLSNNPKARIGQAVRTRIRMVADKYDYMPNSSARALVTGRAYNIGFIFRSSITDFLQDPFTQEVFLGAESEIEKNEHGLLFALLKDDREWNPSVKRMLYGRSADGIILMGGVGTQIVDFLQKRKLPFVVIDFIVEQRKVNTVLPANADGAYEAVRHLVAVGCKKIVCLNGIAEVYPHQSYTERPEGYGRAMDEAGLARMVVETKPDIESAEQTVASLLASGLHPDAFFATGDHMAIGCLRAVRKLGAPRRPLPRIVGFDNIGWLENESPQITSVNVPKVQMGQEAVRLLFRNIENPGMVPQVVRLATSLVMRET